MISPISRLLAAVSVLALACGETTTTTPTQLNLDRPVDITFTCYGGLRLTEGQAATKDQQVVVSAQPTSACDLRSAARSSSDPDPVPPGQEDLTAEGGPPISNVAWVGFVLQQGPGTVAIVQFATKPATAFAGGDVGVLDADPLTPGKNGINVGEDPIAIVTDRSGCKAVTANAGSCDLSELDVGSALDLDPAVEVSRRGVVNGAGAPIRARAAAMVAEPSAGPIGVRCEANASGIAYIAYPSCHLVAAVDLATATVVRGVSYDPVTGVPSLVDGADVTCPDECGGAVTAPGVRPIALDLVHDLGTAARPESRRLVIGADNSPALAIVELGADFLPLGTVTQVALEDRFGDLGVTSVAMSPVIGMGGSGGLINDEVAVGGPSQFVYAVATDGTVRVADVYNDRGGAYRECDTQVDPRFLREVRSVRELACLPVGDPATPVPARRANARGPGIELVGAAVPMSVEIIKSAEFPGDSRLPETPAKLVGYFAVISASNGETFIANIDDDDRTDLFDPARPLIAPVPLVIPHQLRDSIPDRGDLADTEVDGMVVPVCDFSGPVDSAGNLSGGPRAVTGPTRNVAIGSIAPERVGQLPTIRQLVCTGNDSTRAVSELGYAAPEAVRDLAFPDLRALRGDETWSISWEGSLSLDPPDAHIDGPPVRESEARIDDFGRMHLIDQARPYCDAGVEQWDAVQLRGCDPANANADCPINYKCFVHPQSQIPGLGACMLTNEADRLADACKDFLTTFRRYTIGQVEGGELLLLSRRHELRTTPLDGCTDDAQCEALADYALQTQSSTHPSGGAAAEDPRTWTCTADPNRAPVPTGKRCAMRCDTNADCVVGTVCHGADPATADVKEGFCMEGVTPPQSCVNAPQRYELRAGRSFAVIGTRSGYLHPWIMDATGQCVRDPDASPLLAGRIPIDPPACDPAADPLTGALPGGGFEPNPCAVTVTHAENRPSYVAGSCTAATPATELVEREAPGIRFRNRGMTFTMVDPFYPGDDRCIGDRGGTLDRVPLLGPGFQISFRQTAGFSPLVLPINPTFPVKVVRGPTESIWVIDEGDFLSTSQLQASTRGKVFRIEPHSLGLVNILE